VREPKEVERLQSALPLLAPPLGRKAAKLNQARFVGMQSQTELGGPFLEYVQKEYVQKEYVQKEYVQKEYIQKECIEKRSRRSHRLEAHDTVVSVTEHDDLSLPWRFPPALNP
jgi:hypothetical protein